MARSKRRRSNVPRCRLCRLQRLPEETFVRGLCLSCLELDRRKRRSERGRRLLDVATDGGTVQRDDQTFHVVVLPPKRRSSRRIR
jgi:hypothetical protein